MKQLRTYKHSDEAVTNVKKHSDEAITNVLNIVMNQLRMYKPK